MKRVLVVAYYFPPFGLSGVQRVLKFVKYLPEYGWLPTVLTTEPHAYLAFDDSLLADLDGRPIEVWRTGAAGAFAVMKERTTVKLKAERVRKALNRISQFVFVPDNKVHWKKAVLALLESKDMSQFDAVFTTAPPFTSHGIGIEIKRRYGLPLVADFRDSWLDNPWHLYWTPLHRLLHKRLERQTVVDADALVATNPRTRSAWLRRYGDTVPANKMFVVEQGYDPDDFAAPVAPITGQPHDVLHFVYTGIFYEERHPVPLYHVLRELQQRMPDVYRRLKFTFVGYVQDEYRAAAQRLGVDDRFEYTGYVEHDESVAWLQRADVLWMIMGDGGPRYQSVSPGKTFEYIGSRKPIFAMTGECYTKEVLDRFSHTFTAEPSDVEACIRIILHLVELKQRNALPCASQAEVEPYSRFVLTGSLAEILNSVAG